MKTAPVIHFSATVTCACGDTENVTVAFQPPTDMETASLLLDALHPALCHQCRQRQRRQTWRQVIGLLAHSS